MEKGNGLILKNKSDTLRKKARAVFSACHRIGGYPMLKIMVIQAEIKYICDLTLIDL